MANNHFSTKWRIKYNDTVEINSMNKSFVNHFV